MRTTLPSTKPWLAAMGIILAAATLPGCSDSDDSGNNGGGGSGDAEETVVTVDATAGLLTRLNASSGELAADGEDWHVAYQKYVGFSVNTGVKACVAFAYEALFDNEGDPVVDEFKKLTAANTLADFKAVDATTTDCELVEDSIKTLVPASGWWTYNSATGGVVDIHTDNSNGWIIKSADGQAYARIRFSYFATRTYTMRLAVEQWDAGNTEFVAEAETPDLNFTDAAVYWDMESNSIVTEDDAWELKFDKSGRNVTIQINGGASGDGSAGVAGADAEGNPQGVGALIADSVWDVADPTDTNQVYKYFADSAESALSGPGDYGAFQYGVGGDNHDMWPTFTVYLLQDEASGITYKVQVLSNKGEDGTAASGTLRIRYAEAVAN